MDKRKLLLTICNYTRTPVCPIFDNNAEVSGQAEDVVITTERNGWKELSFSLPSVCTTEKGIEPNFRADYLKADYLIQAVDDYETDWYIISEPKITHQGFSKKIEVTAGHVAQLLKIKNYGLEFSDDEGNNVGTCEELLTTILDGTGWSVGYVYPFAEKNGDTKYRSLKASTKTGAFKLITSLCDLFEAKPVYHGGTRTVDIYPMNPFSQPAAGELPDLSLADEVMELHYGKNVSNVSRTLNTENIVTKMYAYGSYGDKTSGYCGIEECVHSEYTYTLTSDCEAGTYCFTYTDEANLPHVYHFTTTEQMSSGDVLIYSTLDPASRMYIWNDTQKIAYPVTSGTSGTALPEASVNREVQNWFSFIMDFDYYKEIGLFTDDMLQLVANYQRESPELYQKINAASAKMSETQTKLSEIIGYVDFCRFAVEREEMLLDEAYVNLVLDRVNYADGIIYRTDYDKIKKNQFKWRESETLDKDGDPINTAAGIVYIVHDTDPITWDKAYLKKVFSDSNDNVQAVTLWAKRGSITINPKTDKFYLFAYNSVNGSLGTLEVSDESAVESLTEAVKQVTVEHPVEFINAKDATSSVPEANGYAWRWMYYDDKSPSKFFFCYEEEGDGGWKYVYFQEDEPTGSAGQYWFDWRASKLYRYDGGWVWLDTASEKRVAALFPTVYMYGKTRDKYYQGLSTDYTYTVAAGETLPAGNYFIENEYSSYWTFTTTDDLSSGDKLNYNYDKAYITQTKDGADLQLSSKAYRFDNVSYHAEDILDGHVMEEGSRNKTTGDLEDDTSKCRTQGYYSVVAKTKYVAGNSSVTGTVHYYDDKKRWLSCESFSDSFTTPSDSTYICIVFDMTVASFEALTDYTISAEDKENLIVIQDLNYKRLSPVEATGDNMGILSLMERFSELSDLTYITYYNELKALQDEQNALEKAMTSSLGDLYREGWWQDDSYVDGDESKLYDDALENLEEVAKPEAEYSIEYLDLYEADLENAEYGITDESVNTRWPDISMMNAVHLIDPEISIDTWAYFEKIEKCYDKPWETKIELNTNLSTLTQHSFTDVVTNIANVASKLKTNMSYYDKSITVSASVSDLEDVNAAVVQQAQQVTNTVQELEQIGDVLLTHETAITQTQSDITLEASRAVDEETKLNAKLRIAADAIEAEVTRASSIEGDLRASIKETSDSITSEVSRAKNAEEELSTSITQTASGIRSEVNSSISNLQSVIDQQNESIELAVNTVKGFEDGSIGIQSLENSSVKIDTTGVHVKGSEIELEGSDINLNGGDINMTSDSSFKIESGGTVQINANNGTESYITLGDMFSATADGGVVCEKASFTDAKIKGYDIITKELLSQQIIVSTTQPTGNNILWFQPSAIAEVKYSALIGTDANRWFSSTVPERSYTLSAQTGDVMANGTLTYTIEVPFWLPQSVAEPSAHMLVTATKKSDTSKSITFEADLPSLTLYKEITQTVTVTSTINLCESTDDIDIVIHMSNLKGYGLHLKDSRNIIFTCQNKQATAAVMPCNIFYLP